VRFHQYKLHNITYSFPTNDAKIASWDFVY